MRARFVLSALLATGCTFDVRGIAGDELSADAPVTPIIDGAVAVDAPPPPDAPRAIDAPPPDAGAKCGASYVHAAGGWYRESTSALSWYDAEVACEVDGAHLAVIFGSEENSALGALGVAGQHWIGMSDRVNEGTFRWVTGDSLDWDNWNSGEPNDSWFNEDCGILRGDATWNDGTCSDANYFLCECDDLAVDPGSF